MCVFSSSHVLRFRLVARDTSSFRRKIQSQRSSPTFPPCRRAHLFRTAPRFSFSPRNWSPLWLPNPRSVRASLYIGIKRINSAPQTNHFNNNNAGIYCMIRSATIARGGALRVIVFGMNFSCVYTAFAQCLSGGSANARGINMRIYGLSIRCTQRARGKGLALLRQLR